MPHPVADLLLMSRKAALAAINSGNDKELSRAVELAYKTITHPSAGNFFDALAIAMRENPADDGIEEPDIDEVGLFGFDPESDETVDEDSDASSPADEDLVNHDEETGNFTVAAKGTTIRVKASTLENAGALPWVGTVPNKDYAQSVIARAVNNLSKVR